MDLTFATEKDHIYCASEYAAMDEQMTQEGDDLVREVTTDPGLSVWPNLRDFLNPWTWVRLLLLLLGLTTAYQDSVIRERLNVAQTTINNARQRKRTNMENFIKKKKAEAIKEVV